jgi:hypothetical protein
MHAGLGRAALLFAEPPVVALPPGVEPGCSAFGGRALIHWATGALRWRAYEDSNPDPPGRSRLLSPLSYRPSNRRTRKESNPHPPDS